jgi:hypothetical protein
MTVRPDVVVGYAKPKPRKRKAVRKRQTLGDVTGIQSDRAKTEASIQRQRKKARPKVDTGDITRTAKAPSLQATMRNAGRDIGKARVQQVKRESFTHSLKRELEGKGTIAHALKSVAEKAGKGAVIVSTGGGPTVATRIGTGQSLKGGGKSRTAAILAPHGTKSPKIVTRTLKDLFNFPAQAIPSVYVPAAAAVEAVQGRPARGKKLLHDLPHSDPVAALVTGHPKRALKLAEEHPGFTALEALGAKGTAGRGVTRAQEATGARPTVRAPRQGPEGTDLRQPRAYSRDATTRAIQKTTERRQARKAQQLRQQGHQQEDPALLAAANRKDPSRMSDAEIRKRVDERMAVNETIRRQNRTRAMEETHRAITGTKTPTGTARQRAKTTLRNEQVRVTPTAATTLHAQAITRASLGDLRKYRDELAAQHEGLRPSEQVLNKRLRDEIDKAIRKNPDPVRLKQTAEDFQRVMAPRQAGLVERGILSAQETEKAPLVPYATRHMGAKHGQLNLTPVPSNAIRAAKAQRRRAERAVLTATRKAAKTEGATRVRVSQADSRALRSDKTYRQAALGLSRAQREFSRARMAHRNAHRNEGLWTPTERVAIERRAANAQQALGAARQRFETVKAERVKALAGTLDKRPVAALNATERSQSALQLAEQRRAVARENVKVVKRQYREYRAAKNKPPQLLTPQGRPLSAEAIEAHMQARGVAKPAYVTQAPGQRGAKNFYVSSGQPPRITGGPRTGRATRAGTFEAHPDVLTEGVTKAQGLIDAADGFTNTIREFAHKPTLGKLATKRDADAAARDLEASTGQRFRPVRINPFAGRQEQLKALLDKAGGEGGLDETVGSAQPIREAMDSAIRGEDGPGPWGLMPEPAAAQMAQHLHSLGVGPKAKALQVVGSGFRRTVLATSPTWLTGNVTEAAGRAMLARAGPRSYVTGRRTVRALAAKDPAAAQELSARALSGGHYGMADRQHIRRDSTQFQGGTVLEPLARGLGAFWRAPGPKHAAAAWKGWTDLVFRQLNGRLESQFQTAMLGKALRDNPLMDGHTLKMSHEAVEQAARGLTDTNEQAALAREVERMYGKYQAFSPDTKWAISTYTPFIAWTLNAVRFVTDVLPRDHPTVTALIAASEQATDEWRKDKGLDLFIQGALPGFLQGSIPLSGGKHQRAPFRYTPFGAFGDPLDTAGGAVLPQFSGILAAFRGEDWKGAKLRKPNGEPADTIDKAHAAAASFIDATVPIVAQAGRINQKGVGALNPVAPVAPAKPKVRKGTSRTVEQDIDAILSDPTQRDIDQLLNGLP